MFALNLASRRNPDPFDAARATFNARVYKPESAGTVYAHLVRNKSVLDSIDSIPPNVELDYVDIKFGRTNDLERRRGEYERVCDGEVLVWCFYYETQWAKLLGKRLFLWD